MKKSSLTLAAMLFGLFVFVAPSAHAINGTNPRPTVTSTDINGTNPRPSSTTTSLPTWAETLLAILHLN